MKTFSQLCAIDLCRMSGRFTGRLAALVIFCHIRFHYRLYSKFFVSGRCFPPWSIRASQLIFTIVFSSCEPTSLSSRRPGHILGKSRGNFFFCTRKIVHTANESFVNDQREWNGTAGNEIPADPFGSAGPGTIEPRAEAQNSVSIAHSR